MKKIKTYISLLALGGLILVFYYTGLFDAGRLNTRSGFKRPGTEAHVTAAKIKPIAYSILEAIAGKLAPVLKNIN